MKKVLKVFGYILMTILILITAINLVYLVKRLITKEECPTIFNIGYAVITTESMKPTIDGFDMIIIKKEKEYEINDIVTFKEGNSLVTHRIVNIEEKNNQILITTRGDANNTDDTAFPKENIVGKVIAIIPNVGYVQQFLQQPTGIILIMGIIVGVFIIPEFFKKKKKE